MSDRSAAEDQELTPDPTHSETRLRAPAADASKRARPSIRPSAFGPPRRSAPPGAGSGSPATPGGGAAAGSGLRDDLPPRAEATGDHLPLARMRAWRGRFSQALPSQRPAWLETKLSAGTALSRARRPLISIALFCSMLALSAITVLRHAWRSDASGSAEPAPPAARPSEARRALDAVEAMTPQPRVVMMPRAPAPTREPAPTPPKAQDPVRALRARAERALSAGDTALAEELYGRILERDETNPHAAHGLSRIRLLQGNLSGAEGWIQLAIRKRPRRAAYRALYAEILERLGRSEEALEERLRAAGGAH